LARGWSPAAPIPPQFSLNLQNMQQKLAYICFNKLYPNSKKNVENTGKLSLTPLSHGRPSLHRFLRNSRAQWHCVETFHTELYPNRSLNMDSMGKNSFTPSSKVRPWYSPVLLNSYLFKRFL
jgi:hypothetical protein